MILMIKRIENWFLNYKEKRRRKQILKDIKKAKQIYLDGEEFMCFCLRKVNPDKYSSIHNIRKIIPEFKPTTFINEFCPDKYFGAWWPVTDRESRINAFNKLIEIYSK